MPQNLLSLSLSEADWAEIDAHLSGLESKLAGLIDLPADVRRGLTRMGDKSEAFCRQALVVLGQNPQVLPPSFDLAESQRDLAQLDQLRVRTARLRMLFGKAEDSETALGSDLMSAALEGYALLKLSGKGSGLEALRKSMSARFSHTGAKAASPAASSTAAQAGGGAAATSGAAVTRV